MFERAGRALLTLATAAVALSTVAAAASPTPSEDAAVLYRLRDVLLEFDPLWMAGNLGWSQRTSYPPCLWDSVVCDEDNYVVQLDLSNFEPINVTSTTVSNGTVYSPLLPEMAAMPQLRKLVLARYFGEPWAAIPPEWVVPGAFPRLEWLWLAGRSLGGPLPDIPPGAMPLLRNCEFDFRGLHTTLPPGWGSDPAVMPALIQLSIQAHIQGQLPTQWSRGFRRLQYLAVITFREDAQAAEEARGYLTPATVAAAVSAATDASTRTGANGRLPDTWPTGFPRLELLAISNMDLSGQLPPSWQMAGGFPSLSDLEVSYCGLTGTLHPQLLDRQPPLLNLNLDGNKLTGSLPQAWAFTPVNLLLLANNSLHGRAFPSEWLVPGAMSELSHYDVSGNRRLTGTLPPSLAWPSLSILRLAGTGVNWTVPDAWCQPPISEVLMELTFDDTSPPAPKCANHTFHTTDRVVAGSVHLPALDHTRLPGSLALSLLLAAAAVLVGAGGFLARRQQLQPELPLHQAPSLLHAWRQGWAAEDARGSKCALLQAGSIDSGASSWAGNQASSRHGRFSALLRSTAPGNGTGLILPLSLASAEVQPAGLTHHLLPHSQGQPSEGAVGGSHGGRSLPLQGWGLDSLSLQIRTADLEFVVGSQGELVILGEGGQAVVYLAHLQGHGQVAAKVTELQPGLDSKRLWHEVLLHRKSVHPRVVPLIGVALTNDALVMAMELMPGGTLKKALQKPDTRKQLLWHVRGRQVALDVAEGLHFLHAQAGVQHNDLKASNVLLTLDLRACISDLGIAQVACSRGRTAAGCTPAHAAPEQLMGERCTQAADLYSFGVLLVELTTQTAVKARGEWSLPQVPAQCSQAGRRLIQQCMAADPTSRPTAAEALQALRADALEAEGGQPLNTINMT